MKLEYPKLVTLNVVGAHNTMLWTVLLSRLFLGQFNAQN
jgi:hypothetical protein